VVSAIIQEERERLLPVLLPFQDPGDILFQPGKILVCCIPHLFQIDPEVLVDEKMPHGDDVFPWNFLVLFLEFR